MDIDVNNFKLACNRYGLDYNKALYCENVLVVPSERNNIYVTFDKRCNVIDVGKYININGNADDYFECIYNILMIRMYQILLFVMMIIQQMQRFL